MKKLLLSTLLLTSLLVACGNTPTSNADSLSENPTSIITTTSEDDLPPPPESSQATGPIETGSVTIDGQMPGGWTYITNNVQYPNPEFYSDGGLKLNFTNQAIKSPVYDELIMSVTLSGKLNKNTRTEGSATTLTLFKVSGATETEVDSVSYPTAGLTEFSETLTITGGANQFMIKLSGNVGYNVNIKTITLG
jgi:hypothetical protein